MQTSVVHIPASLIGTRTRAALPLLPSRRRAFAARCSAQKKEQSEREHERSLGPKLAAAALAASLLLSATAPEDALAARSGGRVGGSSFRSSAPRSAPAAPRSSGPSVRNYNYYSAPPLVGGYGGYGYGYGGGISIFPSFGVPLFYGGGIFNILIFMFIASAILGAVRNLFSKRRDDFDEFDD